MFEERGKPEYPERKPLGAEKRTNNKLNPHMAPRGEGRGENRSTRRKTSRSREENQQQTQPTYDTGGRGERGKPEYPERKPLGARKRTNKLTPHETPDRRIEPGPHWWKASTLTTTSSLFHCSPIRELEILRRQRQGKRPFKIQLLSLPSQSSFLKLPT